MSVQRKSDEMLDRIATLSERLNLCEQQGKLLEAESLSKDVAASLQAYSKLASREIRQQQRSKQAEIEYQYERTADRLSEKWEERLREYQLDCSEQEDDIIMRQEKEIRDLKEKMSELPDNPKPSAEWLQMNKIKQHLIKNKAYQELHFTVKKLQEIEKREQKQHNKTRRKKIYGQIEGMQKKHEREHENLIKRMKRGFEELVKQRDKEFDMLYRRYNNGCNEMKIQHGQEMNYVLKESIRLRTPSKVVKSAIARHFKSVT